MARSSTGTESSAVALTSRSSNLSISGGQESAHAALAQNKPPTNAIAASLMLRTPFRGGFECRAARHATALPYQRERVAEEGCRNVNATQSRPVARVSSCGRTDDDMDSRP